MADLPTFGDGSDDDSLGDAVEQRGRTLIPWLSDPLECDQCGALMYASETFDPREAVYVTSWECRECDAPDRYRDPEYGGRIVEGPGEGSRVVRETLRER